MSWLSDPSTQPPAARRALALGILALALLCVWQLAAGPIAWLATSQTLWRAEVRAELARDRGWAARMPALNGQLNGVSRAPVWSRFYENKTGASAADLVRQDLISLSASTGAVIQNSTVLPSKQEAQWARHGVRVSASMTSDQLRRLIAAIRSHPRYLRVERLRIQAPQTQASDQNPTLLATFDVYGFAR